MPFAFAGIITFDALAKHQAEAMNIEQRALAPTAASSYIAAHQLLASCV